MHAAHTHLMKLDHELITVMDLAEPLVSFDQDAPTSAVKAFMKKNGFDVVGVRREGRVAGYARYNDLDDGPLVTPINEFQEGDVLPSAASLYDAFETIAQNRRIFVEILGQVGAIATRADLRKLPVRLWLFGIVTLTEIEMTRLLRKYHPTDKTLECLLSEGRLDAAQKIYNLYQKKGEELKLLDCLQFCDKAQLIVKTPEIWNSLNFSSKGKFEELFQKLEGKRDQLAHGHDFVPHDATSLFTLVKQSKQVLERFKAL